VDPFAAIMLGGVALLLVVLLLLGRFYPGSGAQQLDWRPTRSPELEAQNEIADVDQMREAVNRRRRARGEAELTEDDLRARVAEDLAERQRLHGSGVHRREAGGRDRDAGPDANAEVTS
jgi:hypothetical protein